MEAGIAADPSFWNSVASDELTKSCPAGATTYSFTVGGLTGNARCGTFYRTLSFTAGDLTIQYIFMIASDYSAQIGVRTFRPLLAPS